MSDDKVVAAFHRMFGSSTATSAGLGARQAGLGSSVNGVSTAKLKLMLKAKIAAVSIATVCDLMVALHATAGEPATDLLISAPRNADPLELVTANLSWQGGTPPFQVELDYGQANAPLVLPLSGPTTQTNTSWSWRNFAPDFVTVRATLVNGVGTRTPFDDHYMVFGSSGPYYIYSYPYVEFDGVDCFSDRLRRASGALNPEYDLAESFIEIVGESGAGGPIVNWRNELAPMPPFFVNNVLLFEQFAPPPSGPVYYGILEQSSMDGLQPPLAYGDYDIPETIRALEAPASAPSLAAGEQYRMQMSTSGGGCSGGTAELVLERNPPPLGVAAGEVGLVSEIGGVNVNGTRLPPGVEATIFNAIRLEVSDAVLYCQAVAGLRAILILDNLAQAAQQDCDAPCNAAPEYCAEIQTACEVLELVDGDLAWELLFSERSMSEIRRECLANVKVGAVPGTEPDPVVIEAPVGIGQLRLESGPNVVVRGTSAEATVVSGGAVEIWQLPGGASSATQFAALDGPVEVMPFATPSTPLTLESGFRVLVLETGEMVLIPPDTIFGNGFEE